MKVSELGSLGDKLNFEDHCKLDRKKYAEALTSLLGSFKEGGVIALNNQWGTGKTTFVHMWRNQLKNKKYKSIYFNAWENDFEDNPLAPIIAELTHELKNNEDILIEKGTKLISNVLTTSNKIIVNKILGNDSYTDIKKIGDLSLNKHLKNDVNQYLDKKKAIEEFKSALKNYIIENKTDDNDNVVFFIDELDRCRPNYAVNILEIIKHFFSVSNIIFVLSIDKQQLAHAICGVYGSDKIDTDEYLRRFIDIEYSLPKPSDTNYVAAIIESSGLKDILVNNYESKVFDTISSYVKIYFSNSTLRQLEKILLHIKTSFFQRKELSENFMHLYLLLLYLKFNREVDYRRILKRDIEVEEFSDFFFDLTQRSPISKFYQEYLIYLEAILLYAYCCSDKSIIILDKRILKDDKVFIYKSKLNQEQFEKSFSELSPFKDLNGLINYIELVPSY